MSLSKSESDVILNRANVALSRSQRLVASWLPEKPSDEPTKTDEELQKEEDEIFTAVPETYALNPLPQIPKLSTNAKLASASEPPSLKKPPTEAGTAAI